MAANEALNALSTTDASNTPAGGDTIGTSLDDELRSLKANIARSARWEHTATAVAAATIPVTGLHKIHPVDGSAGGSVTLTLPTVANAGDGFTLAFLKTGNTNAVIIDGNGAETIDGSADITLSATLAQVILTCNGTSWYTHSDRNMPEADLVLSGTLSVGGTSTLTGAVTGGSTLSVAGATNLGPLTLRDELTVSSSAVFKSSVSVAGASVLTGAVTGGSTLSVAGAANLGPLTLRDELTVSSSAVFKSSVSVAGASVLVRQAMEFIGIQNITQDVIYDHIRNTADVFYDAATNANYHRLNVQAALQSIMPADDYGNDADHAHDLRRQPPRVAATSAAKSGPCLSIPSPS